MSKMLFLHGMMSRYGTKHSAELEQAGARGASADPAGWRGGCVWLLCWRLHRGSSAT
jgi:hypothetical protein